MNELNQRFQRLMTGRYGSDELERLLMVVCVVLIGINLFARSLALNLIVDALLILAAFRMLSRNSRARSEENKAYLRFRNAIKERIESIRRSAGTGYKNRKRMKRDKDYRYFSCPSCGQRVRVPKGKGHVRIICPTCKTEFEEKA